MTEYKNNSEHFASKSVNKQLNARAVVIWSYMYVDGDVSGDHCQQYLMDRNEREKERERKK